MFFLLFLFFLFAALSDEIRKLVNEKDSLQSSLNLSLGEIQNAKRRAEDARDVNVRMSTEAEEQEKRREEEEERRRSEAKGMEETRLSELRKSFEERYIDFF